MAQLDNLGKMYKECLEKYSGASVGNENEVLNEIFIDAKERKLHFRGTQKTITFCAILSASIYIDAEGGDWFLLIPAWIAWFLIYYDRDKNTCQKMPERIQME